MKLGDGIDVFRESADPRIVADWIGKTAVWPNPDGYRMLPVWAPYTYRKCPLYKANWKDVQTNKKLPKFEGNVTANTALVTYLGLRKQDRKNWSCCHIWGNDDDSYQSGHSEVNDARYFSCPANMVLLPSPLKTFTDTVPEIKNALRLVAYKLYDFCPDGREVPTMDQCGNFFPQEWKDFSPPKLSGMTEKISNALRRQVEKLKYLDSLDDVEYPRDRVREVAIYWTKKLPGSLLEELT
jgi:hypothetical protein